MMMVLGVGCGRCSLQHRKDILHWLFQETQQLTSDRAAPRALSVFLAAAVLQADGCSGGC